MGEFVVLGTASQAPTRARNQNGYFLRWNDEGILFDPGEGTQRQMTLAGVRASAVTRICITHFHGDHCLGLPGVLQRLSLDGVGHPVDVYFPASGTEYFERLRRASIFHETVVVRAHPIAEPGTVAADPSITISVEPLEHGADTFGYRITEPDGRRMVPHRLEAAGVRGPDIGRLQREGVIEVDGRHVRLDDVSEPRRGRRFAFVMDTRWCPGAVALADGVDLLVCESTFLAGERELADAYGHMTAGDAGRLAVEAGVRRLLLTHFSQRHPDEELFRAEAAAIFPEVVAARDLFRTSFPSSRG